MKTKKPMWILRIVIMLFLISVIGIGYYLFIYDMNKPREYQPQIEGSFLQTEIKRLAPVITEKREEVIIEQNGFKGIVNWGCAKGSIEEIQEYIQFVIDFRYPYGEHFVFEEDSSEIVVWDARYTPLAEAWGYGWWSYEGNLYEKFHGREKAAEKPNFRNLFSFTIRREDEQFQLYIFCDTESAEKALSETIDYINVQNS